MSPKWKHGFFGTPEYNSWVSAKQRCRNPKDRAYARYGGTGIRFSPAFDRFEDFIAHMGRKPSPAHSLDRIDGTKGYEPGNVRWATPEQQNRNRRTARRITASGQCLTELAIAHGIHPETVRSRLRKGWDAERALTTPRLQKSGRPKRSPVHEGRQ